MPYRSKKDHLLVGCMKCHSGSLLFAPASLVSGRPSGWDWTLILYLYNTATLHKGCPTTTTPRKGPLLPFTPTVSVLTCFHHKNCLSEVTRKVQVVQPRKLWFSWVLLILLVISSYSKFLSYFQESN